MGNFDFIKDVFLGVAIRDSRGRSVAIFNAEDFADECSEAESHIYSSPDTALMHARKALEQLVIYLQVGVLDRGRYPNGDLQQCDLIDRINDLKDVVPSDIIGKMHMLRQHCNGVVHADDGRRTGQSVPVTDRLAFAMLNELFHVVVWAGQHATTNPGKVPAADQFSAAKAKDNMALNAADTRRFRASLTNARQLLTERDQRIKEQGDQLAAQREENLRQQQELERLREQVKQAQAAAAPDPHDYTYGEAETRAVLIDDMLVEQGWKLGGKGLPDSSPDTKGADATIEVEVHGMPVTPAHPSGKGYADYVLWGDDGRPLAVVEAKSARVGVENGLRPALDQARAYADCLEREYGRRPVIFASSGYETAIWDQWTDAGGRDVGYVSRPVQGFYKKNELELLLARRAGVAGNERTQRKLLATEPISTRVAGRPYQIAAIKTVDDAFDARRRGALLVMATGTGKTRVAIALIAQLMKANWVQNVLFLADRTALVNQAAGAFKKKDTGLGASAPIVNLLDAKERDTSGSIYLSTYQTMMNLINARGRAADADPDESAKSSVKSKGTLRFGPGFFDLIVVDEAHRSVYAKYGHIFEYFDAMRVGLTATPRNDVDRNTYGLFGIDPDDFDPDDPKLPAGLYVYDFDQAVKDGYLVPARGLKVETSFTREGVAYSKLDDDEKAQWDSLDWTEDGDVPDAVDAHDVNRVLFNKETIDKVLKEFMERGIHVDEGDRIGKTIIFARNQHHADAIKERFDHSFASEYGENFARVITHRTRDAQSLIDDFADPDKLPQIAISVDMLDTGVDVPEVVNLVFFKPVMSATKYWQMVGRGTRLRKGLFAPDGQEKPGHREYDKSEFLIIDCCGNLAYFEQNLPEKPARTGLSMRERLFRLRLGLLETLDEGMAGTAGCVMDGGSGAGVAGAGSDAEDEQKRSGSALRAFGGDADARAAYRAELSGMLEGTVRGMDPDNNMIVRPHRLAVETMCADGWWSALDADKVRLAAGVSGLPSAYGSDDDKALTGALPAVRNSAYGFDHLMLGYELGVLLAAEASGEGGGRVGDANEGRAEGNRVDENGRSVGGAHGERAIAESSLDLGTAQRHVRAIADVLLQRKMLSIPAVAACRELLEAIAGDEWWQDVTVPMLETARKRLRGIVHYAKGGGLKPVHTDFHDELLVSEETDVSTASAAAIDMRRFRQRARERMHGMEGNITLARLRTGRPLTAQDLDELGHLLVDAGIGSPDEVHAAAEDTKGGLGMFVRSLVGLDRAAVEEAFSQFLDGKRYDARQIRFIQHIVDELTAEGGMDPGRLYDSPYSDISADGPEELFGEEHTAVICSILDRLTSSAMPVGGADGTAAETERAAGTAAA